jgi:hypothetical protein
MPILVTCECGKKLKAPDNAAGKKVRCKQCGETVTVPAAENEFGDFEDDPGEDTPPAPRRLPPQEMSGLPPAVLKPKKKKQATPAEAAAAKPQELPKWLIFGMILVGMGVIGGGAVLGIKAFNSMAASALPAADAGPIKFVQHRNNDGGIVFDYPEGWEVASGGGTGGVPPWGVFTKGDVEVDIRGDSKGGPLADMLRAGDDGDNDVPELSPVAKLHDTMREIKYEFEFDDYQEEKGGLYQTGYGEGWLAEFTASGGLFGGKIRGYRLTFISIPHQINVICKCKEGNFDANKELFHHVMKSLSR